MLFVKELCSLDKSKLKTDFENIKTDVVVITSEREEHIQNHHPLDYKMFSSHLINIILDPDYILKDEKNSNTALFIKQIEIYNVNVVIKLVMNDDKEDNKNSIITFYRLRDRTLKKTLEKNKIIYKK